MAVLIQMPKLGHTMTEGTVIKWIKPSGHRVAQGEVVLAIETDKTEVEIESPGAGVLNHRAAEGEVVPVGGLLAEILGEGETASAPAAQSAKPRAITPSVSATAPKPAVAQSGRVIASPRAKRIAAERGIAIESIAGTGAGGMITEDDVNNAGAKPAAPTPWAELSPMPSHRVPQTRIQQAGARNLTESWRAIPHFVQMVRVDMSRAIAARRALNAAGAKITVGDLINAAAVSALREHPEINASYSDGAMTIYDRINLGVAMDTPDGLVVPVLHDAGAMDIAAISARCAELAELARTKKLKPRDMELATFTVSNLGAYGIENGTPVIFAPQSALMFAGAIRDEVMAIDGRVEIRPAMQIAIAYDHRGIDGARASRFTTKVKALLESAEFSGAPPALPDKTAARAREVAVESISDSLRTSVVSGEYRWALDGDAASGPDPVSSFLGALGSCLLMSLRVAARGRKLEVGRAWVRARANEKGHVKEIEVEMKLETAIDDAALERLVEVAERGCHIRALIRDDVAVRMTTTRI
jgi:pyruvate/2-oxoglutarate dehydrogenase complex dihydrolipoamide acyltransferase (E2) component/uncharacterized OsmC-like protein